MNLTENDLIEYVRSLLSSEENIRVDTDLFSTGLLDSIGMMGLISFVEERTGAEVAAHEVTLENFDSVARILAYLAKHG